MLNRQWFHKRYAIEQFQEEANGELPGTTTRVSSPWAIRQGSDGPADHGSASLHRITDAGIGAG
jgi:hypothetical protein